MKKFLPGVAAVLLAGAFFLAWQSGLIARLSDYEALIESMRASRVWGPLICIGIQFAQVIIFLIPGEITQIASGYVFGAWKGFLLSLTGIMLGSATAYGLGRLIGRPTLRTVFGSKALAKVDRAASSRRAPTAIFLLFLLPGAPKDAMSYGAGVSGFPLGRFVLISGLGRMPALLASSLIGAQIYEKDYRSMALTAGASVAVAVLFWIYHHKLAGRAGTNAESRTS